MKIPVSELRQLIRETIREMKLGIASPNPAGADFQGYERDTEEDEDEDAFDRGRSFISAMSTHGFIPDEESLANQKINLASDVKPDWDDEEDEEEAWDDPYVTRPGPKN